MGIQDSAKAHLALVFVQLSYGGYHVITKLALSAGVNQLVFCTLRDLLALSVLGPLAYFNERRTRPPMTIQLLFSLILLGFTGIFANQLLFIIGLNLTSPAYASAMQPGIPVFTFLLAVCMGAERVDCNSLSGVAKIGGTVVCIMGAILMSVYQGPVIWGNKFAGLHMESAVFAKPSPEPMGWFAEGLLNLGLDMWHIGVLCLIGNCFCMALYIAYQAPVLAKYPVGLSVTAYSYLFGAIFMCMAGLLGANNWNDWILTKSELFAVIYAGLAASALNYGLLTWSNKLVGPSIVSLYMPLQPLFSSVLAQIFLGTSLYLGSVLGGGLIICGLYYVTWGKMKSEGSPHRRNSTMNVLDALNELPYQRNVTGSILPLSRAKADKL